jgi:hypothetical protein
METISDLKEAGASLLLSCTMCRNNKVTLDPQEAMDRYGPLVRIKDIPGMSRCSKCHSKGAGVIVVMTVMPR